MTIWILLAIGLFFLLVFVLPRMQWISVDSARALLHSGARLVHVRSPAEYRQGSTHGALNVPMGEFGKTIEGYEWAKDTTILVFCASGTRSAIAQRQLLSMGYSNAHNIGTLSRAQKVVSA